MLYLMGEPWWYANGQPLSSFNDWVYLDACHVWPGLHMKAAGHVILG